MIQIELLLVFFRFQYFAYFFVDEDDIANFFIPVC